MRSRLFVTLAVVGWCLTVGHAVRADEDAKDVEKAIAALNEAYQKRDADAIKRLTTEDHVAVTPYYGGPASPADQLATLADLKLTEYAVKKLKVTPLVKDAVVVTYELSTKGTFKGNELAPKSFTSAVWVKRDGAWKEAFYQETPLGGQ